MELLKERWRGLALCLAIAVPAAYLWKPVSHHRRTGNRYYRRNDNDTDFER